MLFFSRKTLKKRNLTSLFEGGGPPAGGGRSSHLPHSTNPSPSASMMTRLTAMETELVKLASAVSP